MSDPADVTAQRALSEFSDVFDDLEALCKHGAVAHHLAERGINVSLLLVGIDGLRAHVSGQRDRAIEELDTVVSELRARKGFNPKN